MTRKGNAAIIMVVLIGATALAMLLPAAVGFTLREHQLARAFVYSSALLGMIAGLIHLATRSGGAQDHALAHPFAILTLAYLLLPAFMAIPLTEAVPGLRFTDAWFEMLSAFTTTGATLLQGEGSRSVDLWRATVAWGGGLFVLISVVALLAPLNLGGVELFRGRAGYDTGPGPSMPTQFAAHDLQGARNLHRLHDQIRKIAPAYLGLTLLLWVFLSMAGNPPLVALMLAMSTLSTSAIAPEGAIGSVVTEALIAAFLVFALSRRLWPGHTELHQQGVPRWRDRELLLAVSLVALICLVLGLRAIFGTTEKSVVENLSSIWAHGFTALSFLTTTGFISSASGGPSAVFPGPSGMVVLGLALFGGGVATTAGGLKLMRVLALGWQARREVSRLLYPEGVAGDGAQMRNLRREGAFAAWLFLMIFIFSLTIVTACLTLTGLSLEDAVVFAVAALTTTGPLPEIAASQPLDWATLGDAAKLILGVAMLMGRLELLLLLSVLWPR